MLLWISDLVSVPHAQIVKSEASIACELLLSAIAHHSADRESNRDEYEKNLKPGKAKLLRRGRRIQGAE
jgi:hypothetical protein